MNQINKDTIKWLKERAVQLNGKVVPDGTSISASLTKTLDEILNQSEQESVDFLKAAAQDPEKMRQLNEVRVFQIGTYVLPKLVFGRFFELKCSAPTIRLCCSTTAKPKSLSVTSVMRTGRRHSVSRLNLPVLWLR